MRIALTAFLLGVLAACGGSSDTGKGTKDLVPVETSTADEDAADALDATCARLGRTWAVAAGDLDAALGLAVMESVDAATDAMKAATDQMAIEQCKGEIVTEALSGNFGASLAAAEALPCSREAELRLCPAIETWRAEGAQIVANVMELSSR